LSGAGTRFSLAKALTALGRDRARARRLAEEARALYAAAGEGFQGKAGEVATWLARP
jgi:hypothetical protein